MEESKVLRLSKPTIRQVDDEKVRLCCDVLEGDTLHSLYYETDHAYEKYLCFERSDSFVLAVLPYALREGLDIVCEAPVTEGLLHNLNIILLPLVVKYDHRLKRVIKVIGETDNSPIEGDAVGTGLSLGVDSLYTVKKKTEIELDTFKLTHLLYTSSKSVKHESEPRRVEARKAAEDLGLPLVIITTNARELFQVGHRYGHPFTNLSAIFALRKLFRIYYYATAYEITYFNVKNHSVSSGDQYVFLVAYALSTPGLDFYMSELHVPRDEKVKEIVDWEFAQKYLRVCLTSPTNCGISKKCKRTLLELDMHGSVEKFRESFDVDYYLANRSWYLKESIKDELRGTIDGSAFMKAINDHFREKDPELMKQAQDLAVKEMTQDKEWGVKKEKYMSESEKQENIKQRELMKYDMHGNLDALNESDVEHYLANKPLYFKQLILQPNYRLTKRLSDYFWEKEPRLMEQAEQLVLKDVAREQKKKENKRQRKLMKYDMLGELDKLDEDQVQHYLANKPLYFKKLILKSEHHLIKPMHDYFWRKEPKLMKQAEKLVKKEKRSKT